MCGFLGVLNSDNFSKNTLAEALSLLKHRGNDSSSIKYIENFKVFLGFQRLAIQDLSKNGNQPMSDLDKKVHILFNGEIYNFKDLKSELKNKGLKFYNESDTEVILTGYKYWGIQKLLNKIQGMFSFCIFDEKKKKFFLSRDKYGMKPMFYSKENSFIFSSECKSILKLLKTQQWDKRGVLNPMFTTYLSPEGKTLFKDICELKQGTYLEYDLNDKKIHIYEYFSLENFVDEKYYNEINRLSNNEILDLFNDKLKKSVSKHLISDVPLGVLYSAGLDSSLIAKISEKYLENEKKDLFFFNTNDKNFQFLSYAEEFAKSSKYNLNITDEKEINFLPQLIEQLYFYETPNKPEGLALSAVCNKAYKKGYKVLLTGDAADELFGGYSIYEDFYTSQLTYNNILLKGIFNLLNKFQPLDLYNFSKISPLKTSYFLRPLDIGLTELPFNMLLNGENRLVNWKKNIEAYSFISDINEKNNQSFILDGLSSILPRYLLRSDRLGMKESVELRIPYLDDDFVKLALNTPLKYKIKPSILKRKFQTKKILRDLAIKNKVPKNIVYRKKFGTPFVYTNQLKKICERMNFSHTSDILEIPSKDIKNNLVNSFDENIDRAQYGFIAIEILGRLYIEGKNFEEIYSELM